MKKILFILTVFCISCQEEITFDLPQAESKIVVEGTIETGFPPYVILTRNEGYFEEINVSTYSDIFVNDVDSIKIWYVNENEEEVIKYLTKIPSVFSEALIGESVPVYTVTDLDNFININGELTTEYSFSQNGKKYYLEFTWNGQKITSETTIPNPTFLDSLWVERRENASKNFKYDIRAWYSDPVEIENNILIKSKRLEHYKRDSTNNDVINEPDPRLILVDAGPDVLVNGESFETYFPRPSENGGFPTGAYNTDHWKNIDNNGLEDSIFIPHDVVLIKFCQIDLPALQFWRGLIRQFASGGNPFSEPLNLPSNINGGLGAFTGYGAVYYKVPIIETTITDTIMPKLKDIF